MVELDNGHQKDFESKLAEALMEMRNQQELQIQMYKDELEKTYNTKVEGPPPPASASTTSWPQSSSALLPSAGKRPSVGRPEQPPGWSSA